MNDNRLMPRLGWLSLCLTNQRTNLSKILLRLRGIESGSATSMLLHRKFMRLLGHVALERARELDILNEIEAVEKQHDALRRRHLLRQAPIEIEPRHPPATEMPEKPPERGGLLKLFGLLYLFSAAAPKPKNPAPAND